MKGGPRERIRLLAWKPAADDLKGLKSLNPQAAALPQRAKNSVVTLQIVTCGTNGRKPPQLTAQTLMRLTPRLPADWAEQRKLLGFH